MDLTNSDENAVWSEEICPICRILLAEWPEIACPNRCDHKFCVACLETWSATRDSCPVCRVRYDQLRVFDARSPSSTSRLIDVTSEGDTSGSNADELQMLGSLQQLTAHITSLTSSIQEARIAAQVAQQAYSALQAEVSALRAHVDELRVVSAQLQMRVGELHNAIARTHDEALSSLDADDDGNSNANSSNRETDGDESGDNH